jgi:hypothetical protein
MCVGCGGTCTGDDGDGDDTAPRFTRHPMGVRPTVVGSAMGPTQIPDHLITPAGALITYEALYSGLGPNGEPAALSYPGSYGQFATRAGRR